jgi:hypothetical protein
MVMNASMGTLMLLQDKPILTLQQGISLCFVVYGFLIAARQRNRKASWEDNESAEAN